MRIIAKDQLLSLRGGEVYGLVARTVLDRCAGVWLLDGGGDGVVVVVGVLVVVVVEANQREGGSEQLTELGERESLRTTESAVEQRVESGETREGSAQSVEETAKVQRLVEGTVAQSTAQTLGHLAV